MKDKALLTRLATEPGTLTLSETPEGFDALILADIARIRSGKGEGPVLHIARDDARSAVLQTALKFFAPEIAIIELPAWDCLPYDRVSPRNEIVARRLAALSHIVGGLPTDAPVIILTTVNAVLTRLPPRDHLRDAGLSAKAGNEVPLETISGYLERHGFTRAGTVLEAGDYAIRGGILDLFPPGSELPLRLDFFGNTLESIRTFDPDTQRTVGQVRELNLYPMSEAPLDPDGIQRFRQGYVSTFGTVKDDDPLYTAITEGRKHPGFEHWLPLFYEQMETVFDYLPDALISTDNLTQEARHERLDQIKDHYDARVAAREIEEGASFGAPAYKPLPPDALYMTEDEWKAALAGRAVRPLSPGAVPEGAVVPLGAKVGRNFAAERAQGDVNIFKAASEHVQGLRTKQRTLIACWSDGSRDRMAAVLGDHGLTNVMTANSWAVAQATPKNQTPVVTLGIEHGFVAGGVAVLTEQDILGDKLVRAGARKRRAENFLREASSIAVGDYVVHVDHGIGRYDGLKTIEVTGAPHDCLQLVYAGGDKLYLPVENIELLSRYGGEDGHVELDKLGGAGWQKRKSKLKERIREIAHHLIKVAAERELKRAEVFELQSGTYDEFCAGFPYQETEDQDRAIADVVDDLGAGKPMDRLVCGDVGFGKTEVALRAAFVAAMTGVQVAIVVPTTLLARQHFRNFKERFQHFPIKVRQLSRLVTNKEANETRAALTEGQIDIVVGTHALLAKTIKFKDLGLLIVDEEQHFGVKHKERLKELRSDVHVLTLTATPIPRTLQLALSGVRDLSIIATPPVDRLAVRTYVSPFDPVVVREALLREHYRGGQSFYVCPRISDLPEAADYLERHVPEVKYVIAHGQMSPTQLEDVMTAFYEGKYDVLVSTTIVESGLDIPRANTLVVHRADMFGLAQLYQIRGRIGRSKTRAYAYLTVPPRRRLTPAAERRLEVLQTLDTLGAGFNLASHDLDIRGAGNLLGDEQSGHIKEVGIELYQSMLEEAVANLRSGELDIESAGTWSPQINLGMAVLIPENYVPDLDTRLSLYKRLADEDETDIDALAAEFIDRFGPLPEEVENLLQLVAVKRLCRKAGVAKIDAGPKGATISFRNDQFANPAGLVELITEEPKSIKVRPDQKLVVMRQWPFPEDRLKGARNIVHRLASLAETAKAA